MNLTKAQPDKSSALNPSLREGLSSSSPSRRIPFVDEVTVKFASGSGGRGAVSFLREKFRPKGGPDGGDGGAGGSVYLVASPAYNTLQKFRYQRHLKADSGRPGEGNRRSGKSGEDLYVEVPIGTVVRNADTNEFLTDLAQAGATVLIAPGGRGGKGNAHFVNSVRQAPEFAQPGIAGGTVTIHLELKLLANVGLIGAPNAGKSTLLAAISRARPKIASYPFTTLQPNLAVVSFEEGRDSLVVADIPGLIEGAHEGAGLGIRFLKHIERTAVLVHLIDVSSILELGEDICKTYEMITRELRSFDPCLLEKPRLVALTKIDLIPEGEIGNLIASLRQVTDMEIFPISAVTRRGLSNLLQRMRQIVTAHEEERA